MTTLLEEAIKKISSLSENEQNEIAGFIISEIEDEKNWYKKFTNSHDELIILADEARKENKQGRTKPMNI